MRPTRKELALAAAAAAAAVLGLEGGLRLFPDLLVERLRPSLYRQAADRELHRVSADVERLYELVPGAALDDANLHPLEREAKRRRVRVNALGLRGPERSEAKPAGVTRIVALGGSNTYGLRVPEGLTWPALLEERLNGSGTGRYEVWNAGVNAYNLRQKVAYARTAFARWDPDLIIVQDANFSRRAFLFGADPAPLLRANPALWAENIPWPWNGPAFAAAAHRRLVARSRVYALAALALNGRRPAEDGRYLRDLLPRNAAAFRSLVGAHPGTPFLLVSMKTAGGRLDGLDGFAAPNLTRVAIDAAGRSAEYAEIHPPSHVYRWYAEFLAEPVLKSLGRR